MLTNNINIYKKESVYEGLNAGMTFDDNIITAYRDHCIALLRGDTPR
jgi:hypothetical protein